MAKITAEDRLKLIMLGSDPALKKRARFSDYIWFNQCNPTNEVTIGGVGTLGSHLAMLVRSINLPLHVVDNGEVKMHNLGGQAYSHRDHESNKVDALEALLSDTYGEDETRESLTTENAKVSEERDNYVSPITFGCFDNIDARRYLYNSWREMMDDADSEDRKFAYYIDMRMRGLSYQLRFVRGNADTKLVKKYLKSFEGFHGEDGKELVTEEPCSLRSTKFVGYMAAADACGNLTNILKNKETGVDIAGIPSLITYDIETGVRLVKYEDYD